ncbi:hypothetical protein CYY_001412 [Polysphondylium violaceum]|uniref:PRELI/MSF1 domain-containing protein n=1 Tax=Polysphondylium violaceum TaxID=133409 RepID=A0A8J4Q217_9MYCE|nr:hypothetical protein CYY_001412 [Polysphondylium violaceum]
MPLFQTILHTYEHLWADASLAHWKKYPSPERPDVLSVDLLSKELDPETGILKITRLIVCKGNTPTWLKSILGSSECFFYEETTVDPKNKVMVLKSQNLNFTNILGVEEVCTYTPDPNNKDWTLFKQEAKVTSSIFGVARKMEAFCLDRFVANAGKGRKIMEDAILKVKLEAEESLAQIETTLDKTITNIKIEAENLKDEACEGIQSILPITKLDDESTTTLNHSTRPKYHIVPHQKLKYIQDQEQRALEFNIQKIFKGLERSQENTALFDFDYSLFSEKASEIC